MENSLLRSSRMKNLWESGNFKVEKAYPGGYPWPPRHYSCSFCGREFSSAQALGGHMNVHRRDRARLRDNSPPSSWVNLNLQNPNPNFSSPSSNIYTNQYSLLTLSLSSFSSPQASRNEEELVSGKKARRESLRDFPSVNISGLEGFSHGNGSVEVSKVREVMKLDLELGLIREEEEELDLELRLGN
ncbi:hypothetical protein Nepgr_022719 [Nepenthes gracilis]|uniref:C2H2-type domain-containing protein n=1 Tax=Nepenthes gracilis TaxID=150966 RepID=A0AAD3XX25_NEPGR|nr:hypothetical protein Nepgr_022719 [Nepenthes gracilis]